jgi:hypothetical protein
MPTNENGRPGEGINPGGVPRNLPGTGLQSAPGSPEGRDQLNLESPGGSGNVLLGILAGSVAALIGAVIWAVITAATGFQIGFMAIGVGLLAGMGVRIGGQGSGALYSFIGAALALFGCLAGNLFAGCFAVAEYLTRDAGQTVSFLDVLLTPAMWPVIMEATFSPMDILFYLIAIYEGWRFASAAGTE